MMIVMIEMIEILRGWDVMWSVSVLYGNEVAVGVGLGGMIFREKEAFEVEMRGRK